MHPPQGTQCEVNFLRFSIIAPSFENSANLHEESWNERGQRKKAKCTNSVFFNRFCYIITVQKFQYGLVAPAEPSGGAAGLLVEPSGSAAGTPSPPWLSPSSLATLKVENRCMVKALSIQLLGQGQGVETSNFDESHLERAAVYATCYTRFV